MSYHIISYQSTRIGGSTNPSGVKYPACLLPCPWSDIHTLLSHLGYLISIVPVRI